jgi:UDP-galactopyranose mutase
MNVVCLSHLRWDFVFQRPQHLLRRAAQNGRVLYIEEPLASDGKSVMVVRRDDDTGVIVAVPCLDPAASAADRARVHQQLIATAISEHIGDDYVLWFYSPMPLPFTEGLQPAAIVYDCMDELAAFAGAPPELPGRERDLFRAADVVFTGGQTLFEAKRSCHKNIHPFPSSVDVEHFRKARSITIEPADQQHIRQPRLGFFGVLDERMDYGLISTAALSRPDWQFIFVGPTAKIDPAALPRRPNLHYLGPKTYAELPSYIAGWDVALLPFARNAATRFISPTKTPEYLAAGKPVVSTPIRDVVCPYGEQRLVHIADGAWEFVGAVERALRDDRDYLVRRADVFLAGMSWDRTWSGMERLIREAMAVRRSSPLITLNAS